MTYLQKIKKLDQYREKSKGAERIVGEITYLDSISSHTDNSINADIEKAADFILQRIDEDDSITMKTALEAEAMLMHLKPLAKSFTETFLGHAHIDMNWMWGYNETATLTIDTFRTVLDLMREYPEFTFAQSQASTYEIVEKYCPEMLDEIKARIEEGRWEVTATEWVEPDKNMPDGESLVRQILQAKKYMSGLLGIPKESLDLDFVPDTFGHNINVPEILANSGVKYMYHWRGREEAPRIYNYVSPSGKKVLCYREFVCYLGTVETRKFEIVPEFYAQTGLKDYICVYGVGDHGGGPTRRDIERILAYKEWPLTPTIKFGTLREFFHTIENSGLEIPEVRDEQNFLFTGCYTSQSRIKMANRIAEARINETEAISASASLLAGAKRNADHLDTPWRNILFNHFHDILPGSGVMETREFAMGKFQETLANVSTYATTSMRAIAANIDTSAIEYDDSAETTSEGSGSGFNAAHLERYHMPSAERGRGHTRVFHVFNPTGYEREEYTQILVWDYNYSLGGTEFVDGNGNKLISQRVQSGMGWYWGHKYDRHFVKVKVAPYGYTTVILQPEKSEGHLNRDPGTYNRSNDYINLVPYVLENDCIKATFDHMTFELIELVDKKTGEKLIDTTSLYFRLIQESTIHGMESWRIGPYASITNLNREGHTTFKEYAGGGGVNRLFYDIQINKKTWMNVRIYLKPGSPVLEFETLINWKEETADGSQIPQLNFAVPVSYERNGKFRCDIPFGYIERKNMNNDVPALSYIGVDGNSKHKIGIVTDCKYGYRVNDDMAALTIIHTAKNPDPVSDFGENMVRFGIMVSDLDEMKEIADLYNHPMPQVASIRHEGKLALSGAPVKISGDKVVFSVMKNSEDGEGTVFRAYDTDGKEKNVTIEMLEDVKEAYYADAMENKLEAIKADGKKVSFKVPALDFTTIVIK